MVQNMAGKTKKAILMMLYKNRNRFLSGQRISEEIGCSRTAIWKHIRELIHEGYTIEAVQKSGYKLAGAPEGLNEAALSVDLHTRKIGRHIRFYDSIGSTQKEALRLADEGAEDGTVVITNEQTAGRGRLGHNWQSQRGKNIAMSLILRPGLSIEKTPQLTLVAAVAAAETIEKEAGFSCGIKWPNDILWQGQKLVGILTELQAEANFVKAVVMGIGINVNTEADAFPEDLRGQAGSLFSITGRKYDLSRFTRIFWEIFESLYQLFLSEGFIAIKPLWEKRAISLGKPIRIRRPGGVVLRGKALGINDEGILLLQQDDQQIVPVYSADIEWN